MGAKLYFPNIIFKLVRSNLPPHQAVFHTPPQLNKFDIKMYLEKLYQIAITDVRTMNYLGRPSKIIARRERGGKPSFKKVIVTMEDDFVFPPPPTVKDGAIKIPPRVSFGRNSARKQRKNINEQALERGIDLNTTA